MSINVVLLCVMNTMFSLCGIFLNSIVIISFSTSSQLRKKTCYFMILVLACYDLAVSSICHPILITYTITWYRRELSSLMRQRFLYIILFLFSNSFIALLGMNLERYLALTLPFFHQRSVTKYRMLTLVLLTQFIFVVLIFVGFIQQNEIFTSILTLLSFILLLALMLLMNYKLLKIAKTIQRNEIVPSDVPYNHRVLKSKIFSFQIKNASTCTLAVGCLFLFSLPSIIFTGLSMISNLSEDTYTLFNLWESSLVATNSTVNCLIFFWKNHSLRSEGKRVAKTCLSYS